jgi:hypothetical protein
MEKAGTLTDPVAMARATEALAYRIIDSGPLADGFCPSFHGALDSLQRSRKKKHA